MRVAVISDTQFGASADSTVLLQHQKKFFDEVFFPELKKRKITKIIHLGDVFDREPCVNYYTMKAVHQMFIDRLLQLDMQMWIIPGNHDTYFPPHGNYHIQNLEETLGRYQNFQVITTPTVIGFEDRSFLFVPWIYHDNLPANLDVTDVLCTHFDILGFEFFKGNKNLDIGFDPSMFSAYSLVLSGHYHHPSSRGNIHFVGSPFELSWNDFGGPRGFHILDTATLGLEFIENPNKIFRKIKYDDTDLTLEDIMGKDYSKFKDLHLKVKVKACKDRFLLEQFMTKLEEQAYTCRKIEKTDHEVANEEINYTLNTLSIIKDYIKRANLTVSKPKLFGLFKDLLSEARQASSLIQAE